jgi:chaperone BCS1
LDYRCILLLEDLDAAFTRGVSRDAASTGAPPGGATVPAVEVKAAEDGSTLSLSGLLNALDGVAAAEGRLLFATTNHIERLDPALSRPGRMDVWVDFKHATQFQAEGIFRCFFPVKTIPAAIDLSGPSQSPSLSSPSSPSSSGPSVTGPRLGVAGKLALAISGSTLTEAELDELAKAFGKSIPEGEFSVASLQGYLLKNKTRPRQCVDEVEAW